MRFCFTHPIPTATLNQAIVPIEVEALSGVCAARKFVPRRGRVRRPDMTCDRDPVLVGTIGEHLRREPSLTADVVIKRIQGIESDRDTRPAGSRIDDID